jgi:hypothetical protein
VNTSYYCSPCQHSTEVGAANCQGGYVKYLTGTYTGAYSDGNGTQARLLTTRFITIDSLGYIYASDRYMVRKLSTQAPYPMSIFAGSNNIPGRSDGVGTNATFTSFYSNGITVDTSLNVYVIDDSRVRKITSGALVTTIARDFTGYSLAIDTSGQYLYLSDTNANVKKILTVYPYTNTTFTVAYAYYPMFSFSTINGQMYMIAPNNRLNIVNPVGDYTVIAGYGSQSYQDGYGTNSYFSNPYGMTFDTEGNIYITEYFQLRKFTKSGYSTTLAGNLGNYIATEGYGTNGGFQYPYGVAVDTLGRVFVSQSNSYRISMLSNICPSGQFSRIGGGCEQIPSGYYLKTQQNNMIYYLSTPSTAAALVPSFSPTISFVPTRTPVFTPTTRPTMVPSVTPTRPPFNTYCPDGFTYTSGECHPCGRGEYSNVNTSYYCSPCVYSTEPGAVNCVSGKNYLRNNAIFLFKL